MNVLSKSILLFASILIISSLNSPLANGNNAPTPNSREVLEQALLENLGKVIYVDFWASWCGPCRKSFPWMNEVQNNYKQQGFTVISINLDANKTLAEKFLAETPANFGVIYDPKGAIAKHFKIQGMPSSMIIGRDGKIKSRHTGFFPNKKQLYQSEIEQLLQNEELKL